uniref:Single-pass membrane and coiled-coil domain-containing protein 2 n=1 Tax=Spermophilus dauricus TaxID=99837 RepID=A0A8C9Q8S2_SPEDA
MELTPPSLNDGTSLQTKTAGKEQPLTEKNNGFLQNLGVTEGAMNLLREMTKMDQSLDELDDKDKVCSETPQTDFLHKDMLEPKAEQGQDLQKEQDEQKPDLVHEVPQVSTSMLFPEKKIPELQHKIWKFRQAHLGSLGRPYLKKKKKKLIFLSLSFFFFFQNFYKEMTLLNTKLGMYQIQERETDSYNSEEMNVEETDPLLPEASPPPLEQNSPPHVAAWKRALRIFIMFYVLTFTGISCYVLFVDATFIFERVLPSILGRRTMWELREMIGPFLNLEVEDLLPS